MVWDYPLLVEIMVNKDSYLTGIFYSPHTADAVFFDALNKNIEYALDIIANSNNIKFWGIRTKIFSIPIYIT